MIFLTHKKYKIVLKNFTKKLISKKYLSWLNDKNLMKYSEHVHYKHSKKTSLNFLNFIKKENNLFFAIGIFDHNQDNNFCHIGNLIVYFDKKNKKAQFSIMIGEKKYRNKGIALFVWNKIIKYIFKKYQFVKVISAGTMEANKGMVHLLKKSKMKLIQIPKFFYFKKKYVDKIYGYIQRK